MTSPTRGWAQAALDLRIGPLRRGPDLRFRLILIVGVPILFALFVLTAADIGGMAAGWELGHWTFSTSMAAALGVVAVRAAIGTERRVRGVAAIGLGLCLLGQLMWNAQVAVGAYPVPAPSDIPFLGMALPFVIALAMAVRAAGLRGQVRTFFLDTAIVAATIVALVFFAFASVAAGAVNGLGIVLLLYPIVYLGLSGAIVVAALLTRAPVAPRGLYLIALGVALTGYDWLWYIDQAIVGGATTGNVINMVASIGYILMGVGVATWRIGPSQSDRLDLVATRVLTFLPVGAIGIATAILFAVHTDGDSLVAAAATAAIVVAIVRQTMLLGDQTAFLERERDSSERERALREGAQQALAARETSEARYRTLVDVFNRLGEQTTFAAHEDEMFTAAAAALAQLVPAPAGDILAINSSANRLCVRVAWGDGAPSTGTAIEIEDPDRCLGIRRAAVFGVDDASDPWTSACPAHPRERGSSLCVPMLAAAKLVGVIHLSRPKSNAFDADDRRQASRIAEQVALAVGNARLIRTMEGLALTDGLTGLHNGRFFDPFIERELALADREGTAVGVIAVDLDHFKKFNDTHGHPAGDEALRTFAQGCLGVLRQSDTMARVGGEEFLIAVRGADLSATVEIAEKLRGTVERLPVEIGPGRFAQVTASFGVVNSLDHGTDRMRLMKMADRALYEAKRQGRNVVVAAEPHSNPELVHSPRRLPAANVDQR